MAERCIPAQGISSELARHANKLEAGHEVTLAVEERSSGEYSEDDFARKNEVSGLESRWLAVTIGNNKIAGKLPSILDQNGAAR